MTSTASPSFPRGLGKIGYSTELPEGYKVRCLSDGYAFYRDGWCIEGGHDTYAGACFAAQEDAAKIADEQAAADAAAAEEAYEDELERLHALVNAQGGIPSPGDALEAARVRAVQTVLDLIDGLATKKAA